MCMRCLAEEGKEEGTEGQKTAAGGGTSARRNMMCNVRIPDSHQPRSHDEGGRAAVETRQCPPRGLCRAYRCR